MPDLIQSLIQPSPLRWLVGQVTAITGDTVTISHDGGSVYEVGVIDQYIPVVGDVVHAIAWSTNGMLILGSNNQPLVARVPPAASAAPVTVNDTSVATYTPSTGAWAAGVGIAGPDSIACWFYPSIAALGTLTGVVLAVFTINLTATSAVAAELVLHSNTSGAGPLILLADASYRITAPPVGVPTVVALPMEWGQRLISGEALGIGIGGGTYTGVWTSSAATLTFVPL